MSPILNTQFSMRNDKALDDGEIVCYGTYYITGNIK